MNEGEQIFLAYAIKESAVFLFRKLLINHSLIFIENNCINWIFSQKILYNVNLT
jgi:hypothetical protein